MRAVAAMAAACQTVLAAFTLATAQTPVDPKSTSDVDPGAVRYFDPEGEIRGRIERSLPFDVPFYLRLPVEDDVQRITGRYVGDTDPLICDEAFPRWRLNVKYADYGAREIARSEQRQELPIGFTRFVRVTEPAELAGRWAELNVARGLLPNRYYCFEFTRVRKAVRDPVAFRQQLADAIDDLLQKNDAKLTEPSLPEDTYRQLRKDVIAALKAQLEPGERLIIPAGSFLDEGASDEAVEAESKRIFEDVIEAQKNRSAAYESLQDLPDKIRRRLEDALKGPVRPDIGRAGTSTGLRILGQSARLVPMPPDLEPIFRRDLDSLDLAAGLKGQPTSALLEVAKGTLAPSLGDDQAEAKPLEQSWEPEDLATRTANLTELGTLLADLQSLTHSLAINPALQQLLVSGGDDTAAALDELSDNLSQALGELDGYGGTLEVFQNELSTRRKALLAVADPLATVIIDTILAEGSTTEDYEVRANWYLGMDLGVAWAEGVEDLFTYVGTNVYFRPVNKKAPLRWSDFRRGQRASELLKRTSVTIGLVINDLARNCRFGEAADPADCRLFEGVSQESITQGLIGDKPLVVAGGLRLSDFFRVSVGALVFKESEADPLLGGSRLAWTPLVSFSIDWNLRGFLRNRVTQQPFPTTETTE